ncbi:acetyl-CoA carboxylase biotin carboxylase subunit family protein [Kutzneria sp. NPDC052558]|uniref:acetyl-CoA carboxylase biotin carboxylase subunit family protein n=1 Tax=Kutzneria sp. NPDC052558 TaxID=3364121 RepID=UPI0037CC309E
MNRVEPGSHVIVINRWREHYADYDSYLDHRAHRVTYVTTAVGRESVPATATASVTVEATDDMTQVEAAVQRLVDRHGPPAHVVALKEDDLLVGAALRQRWKCPGPGLDALALFRDKYEMATAVAAAGLPLPAFTLVVDGAGVREFAAVHGWPVVVKPLSGSSSAGVRRLDRPTAVGAVDFTEGPLLAQAFDPHPIYHVDGVFSGETLMACRASRYLNTCLGFREGGVLGSVEESDDLVNRLVAEHAERIMRALTDRPTVFHLELFVDREHRTCSFLEVGARAGGAEVPFIWRELHGYDLVRAAFRIQLGMPPEPPPAVQPEIGGWLLVPAPARRPCRITEITSMVGRRPGPYAEALLTAGDVLPAADSYYEHVGGRFRFRGRTSAAVAEAIRATAAEFRVDAVPVVRPLTAAVGACVHR